MTDTRLSDARLGGAAMIAAAIAGIIIMALHPLGHGPMTPDHFGTGAVIGEAIHVLSIICTPFAFLGALALTRHMDSPNRLALTALAIYGFALVAIVIAPALSGLVAIPILQKMIAEPQAAAQWQTFATYTGYLNQAFARIYALLTCIAIGLWSLVIVRTRILPRGAGIYGLVISPVVFAAVGSGHVRLDAHGFGAVVLLQGVWFIIVGTALYRTRAAATRSPAAGSRAHPAER
jgi:hypothetical protein